VLDLYDCRRANLSVLAPHISNEIEYPIAPTYPDRNLTFDEFIPRLPKLILSGKQQT
jgi:hypothetical protein